MNHLLLSRIFKTLVVLCIAGCGIPFGGTIDVHYAPVRLNVQQDQQIPFTVDTRHVHTFTLHFVFKDEEDRPRVASLVGGVYMDKSGKLVQKKGLSTPVRLTVQRLEQSGAQEVFSMETDPVRTGYRSRSFEKDIGYVLLTPGQYLATLTPMEAVKQFENTQVYLAITYSTAFHAPP